MSKRLSLSVLPSMRCDDGCGECCGPVLCKPSEYQAVVAYAKDHGIEPVRQGITCPWYQGGKCSVYPVRPFSCQMFGHSPKLVCCRGYNRNVPAAVEAKLHSEYQPRRDKIKMLHEVFPDWQEILDMGFGRQIVPSAQ